MNNEIEVIKGRLGAITIAMGVLAQTLPRDQARQTGDLLQQQLEVVLANAISSPLSDVAREALERDVRGLVDLLRA